MLQRLNITITILSNTLTITAGLPTDASDEMRSCLLRGNPPMTGFRQRIGFSALTVLVNAGICTPFPYIAPKPDRSRCGKGASARICCLDYNAGKTNCQQKTFVNRFPFLLRVKQTTARARKTAVCVSDSYSSSANTPERTKAWFMGPLP